MHCVDSTNFDTNEFGSIDIDLITGQTCRCYWIQMSGSSSLSRLLNSMLQVIQFMLIWFPNKGRVAPAKKIVQYQGNARDANSTPCRNSHPQIFLHMSLKDHLAQFQNLRVLKSGWLHKTYLFRKFYEDSSAGPCLALHSYKMSCYSCRKSSSIQHTLHSKREHVWVESKWMATSRLQFESPPNSLMRERDQKMM
jgi:hypothetical protein